MSIAIMIQGTTSDAGKSMLVTGLCRAYARLGLRVAPFKSQNMALNSAVTTEGGEIGRAQALQALAAGVAPHTDMNPVLLKPNSSTGSQIIINGKSIGNMDARQYHQFKKQALVYALQAYNRLAQQYDLIIIEGAGSPAEINLRENDVANMGLAEAINCPVILMADIHRGGVFAHLHGTLDMLSASEQKRVTGLLINRFRGDRSLLTPGITWLEAQTGKCVISVLPWIDNLVLDAEDSMALEQTGNHSSASFNVVVPRLPRISNHTDFDALALHPNVNLVFVERLTDKLKADLIIIPGSKNVRSDLRWLKSQGWDTYISRHLRYGGRLIGICGGFQMLGNRLVDENGIEDTPGQSEGLGLLNFSTLYQAEKTLRQCTGFLSALGTQPGPAVCGYEIHTGIVEGPALSSPALELDHGPEGAVSEDGQIIGTHLHGLFDTDTACQALLRWAGLRDISSVSFSDERERSIERLANVIEQNVDLDLLLKQAREFNAPSTEECAV